MDKVEEILEAYKRLSAPDQYKVAENILNMEEESKVDSIRTICVLIWKKSVIIEKLVIIVL